MTHAFKVIDTDREAILERLWRNHADLTLDDGASIRADPFGSRRRERPLM